MTSPNNDDVEILICDIKCSICGWITGVNNFYGVKRHEEWHDPKQSHKHASQNKVWGKVLWEFDPDDVRLGKV